MPGVVHTAGEGEAIFGGRIVLKAAFEELCVTETLYADARPGAGPHFHREHVDSFYVLEGELAVLVRDEEVPAGPGGCVSIPPGVVHGFRSTSRARFLNFHTPDGGFAENLRALERGEPGGFDSFDAEVGTGPPPSGVVLLGPGEGEPIAGDNRVATIKAGRDELSIVEFALEPGFEGPDPHVHDDHVDSFYVLEGEAEFTLEGERRVLDAGSFVAAPPGVEHGFSAGPVPSRVLNVHAPSDGFHDWLRENG